MSSFLSTQYFGRRVGFRYLRAKKSSKFLSLITGISAGGICVGVLTMIVTLSVMSGFESELRKRLFAAETHILIEDKNGFFKADDKLLSSIRESSNDVVRVYPVLQTEVILRSGKKVAGAIVKGIGIDQQAWLKKQLVETAPETMLQSSDEAHIFLGAEMAFDLSVIPGDRLTMVSPVETEGPLGAIPRVKRFVVEGIYRTGVPEQELHVVFARQPDVEAFIRQPGVLSQIEVRVRSLDDAPRVAAMLNRQLGDSFLIRPWQVLNAHLFESLRLERTAMFCILIFIVIVAAFNIVSTLTMMVMEKKRSLSILRAMGATPRHVAWIFLWESLAIGIVGVGLGTGIGLGICGLLAKYPVIELPEFFYDRTLPVVVNPSQIALVAFSAMLIVIAAAFVPARKASQLSPIQGIREG